MKGKYFYLVHVQYLGFRFHGWAKQPGLKTVHHMIDRTIRYVLGKETIFKTLGCSRTDAMVSANHSIFELFLQEPLMVERFFTELNANLPADIRATRIEETDSTFNIIQAAKIKEYHYLFTFGEKPHPFSAAVMTYFPWQLDIELMKRGAALFEGTHDLRKYCTRPGDKTLLQRTVDRSSIVENDRYTANFFPENSFIYYVNGRGFMRHQIRLMMAQLVNLGRGIITFDQLRTSIYEPDDIPLETIAPASGLILHRISFDQ
ncbi:MAG: tRNA pseudouridine(38-40) synthase TruA [Cyclobacteriaceae bacterium]